MVVFVEDLFEGPTEDIPGCSGCFVVTSLRFNLAIPGDRFVLSKRHPFPN